jgi:protein TonB
MSTSTLNRADAVRRRMRSMHRAATASRPIGAAVCRLPPPTIGAADDHWRKRVHAMALVVLAVHCAVALKAWRVSVEHRQPTVPRVLDLQFDLRAAVPTPAIDSPQPSGLAGGLAPTVALQALHPSSATRHAKNMATPRNTAQASEASQRTKVASNNTSALQAATANANAKPNANASTQSMPTHADPEAPNTSTAKSPDSLPATEPLAEPSFGAAYLHNPPPAYPSVAQQRGWQGTVLLRVHVLANGRPEHVELASSSGHESLDDAALQAVTNWRFAPARRGEQTIDGWVQVPIDFKLGT